jgi:hypothetical protein
MERMRSGVMQRWFALVLVLCLSLVGTSIVHRDVLAAETIFNQPLDPPGGGGGGGGGSAAGDPDQPQGSGMSAVGGGGAGVSGTGSRRGESVVPGSRDLWRFGVVWMGLRGFWLRF